MIIIGSSIKQFLKNLVHFENAILLITENYLVTSTFCLEIPYICKKKCVTVIATVTEVVVLGVILIVVGALMKLKRYISDLLTQ